MPVHTITSPVHRRRTPLTAAVLAALTALSGCASAGGGDGAAAAPASGDDYPVTVRSCGRDTTVDAAPERAVTINQGATEVLLALGLEDRMVGTAYLDDAVADRWAKAYASVLVLSEAYPDTETLLAAEPDFVYGSYASAFDGDAAGSQDDLQDLGIASYLSPFSCGEGNESASVGADGVTFDDVWGELRAVGTLFGAADRAEQLIADQRASLEDDAVRSAGEGLQVFWFDSGDATPFAGAGDGAPQLLIDAVGATNVFADEPGNWFDASWEPVLAADPDVIVLAEASWSTAQDKIDYLTRDPALRDLTAVREQRFVTLPFSETTPGVRNADAAVSLAEQITVLGL
jgi:iron complex transport system substrate-binding protein